MTKTRMLALAGVIAALSLVACQTTPSTGIKVASVPAVRETAPVDAARDAADDPAIWVAPNPAESLVIATQKKGGIYVFDLDGKIVQVVPGGRPNNVDLRDGFAWPEGTGPIVGAGDRSDNTLVFWRFDPRARKLDSQPVARLPTGFVEVY